MTTTFYSRLKYSVLLPSVTLILLLTAQASSAHENDLHATWDSLLKAHVVSIHDGNSTAVDYAAFAENKAQLET